MKNDWNIFFKNSDLHNLLRNYKIFVTQAILNWIKITTVTVRGLIKRLALPPKKSHFGNIYFETEMETLNLLEVKTSLRIGGIWFSSYFSWGEGWKADNVYVCIITWDAL